MDVHAKLDAVLMLSSVNLPGGELRRRSEEDERMMRKYLQEGDVISAEVQNVMSDGTLSLHTRSLKYGKLGQGVLVPVSGERGLTFVCSVYKCTCCGLLFNVVSHYMYQVLFKSLSVPLHKQTQHQKHCVMDHLS